MNNKNKVELIGYYGSDELIACSAWTSTSRELTDDKKARIPKLINDLWNNGHECYDNKTEILTNRGWVLFKDLNNSDTVCSVNNNTHTYQFEKPSRIVSYDYNEPMFFSKSKSVDFAVTKNHRIYCSQKRKADSSDYGNIWEVQTSQEVSGNSRKYIHAVTSLNKDSLEENFAKLIGFFIGDGYSNTKTRAVFHLKKSRKIQYLNSIYDNIDEMKGNKYVINNSTFDFTKCYDENRNKIIPFDIFELSDNDFKNILDGLLKSDGAEKGRGYEEYIFSNTSLALINQLEILCPLHGYIIKEHKSYNNCKRFLITKNIISEICTSNSRKIGKNYWKDYTGKVYCATVSTGLMLVRRNKKPIVSGNTPFEKGIVHFLVNSDIASHIHKLKHRISSANSESARYKELKEDKFYLPEDWKGIFPQEPNILNEYLKGDWKDILEGYSELGNKLYHQCLDDLTPVLGRKRAKESARYFKAYNSQIECDISFNMRSFANFQNLRNSEHAQLEIREIAQEMLNLVKNIEGNPFEYTLKAWNK